MQTRLSLTLGDFAPKQLKDLLENENCPICETPWRAGNVFANIRSINRNKPTSTANDMEEARSYGWSRENNIHFTRILAVYSSLGRGPHYYQCPFCSSLWYASTGRLLSGDETAIARKCLQRP